MTFNINKVFLACALASVSPNAFVSHASDKKGWYVGPGEVVEGTLSKKNLIVRHELGDQLDGVSVHMHRKGCREDEEEPFSNPYISLSKPDEAECWEEEMSYVVNVDLAKLDHSNPFYNKAAKMLEFCINATSIEGEAGDHLTVAFRMTKFELNLSEDEDSFDVTSYGVDENEITQQCHLNSTSNPDKIFLSEQ